jgi:hypothetical protein
MRSSSASLSAETEGRKDKKHILFMLFWLFVWSRRRNMIKIKSAWKLVSQFVPKNAAERFDCSTGCDFVEKRCKWWAEIKNWNSNDENWLKVSKNNFSVKLVKLSKCHQWNGNKQHWNHHGQPVDVICCGRLEFECQKLDQPRWTRHERLQIPIDFPVGCLFLHHDHPHRGLCHDLCQLQPSNSNSHLQRRLQQRKTPNDLILPVGIQ